MKKFRLTDELSFGIEPYERGVRLIIYRSNEEWVCRKESVSKINQFLNGPDAHLFKGRLQLYKQAGLVTVEVKGHLVGSIPSGQLSAFITEGL